MPDRGAHAARRKDVDNMVGVGPSNWEDGEDESESEAKSLGRKSASLIMRSLCNISASGVNIHWASLSSSIHLLELGD